MLEMAYHSIADLPGEREKQLQGDNILVSFSFRFRLENLHSLSLSLQEVLLRTAYLIRENKFIFALTQKPSQIFIGSEFNEKAERRADRHAAQKVGNVRMEAYFFHDLLKFF